MKGKKSEYIPLGDIEDNEIENSHLSSTSHPTTSNNDPLLRPSNEEEQKDIRVTIHNEDGNEVYIMEEEATNSHHLPNSYVSSSSTTHQVTTTNHEDEDIIHSNSTHITDTQPLLSSSTSANPQPNMNTSLSTQITNSSPSTSTITTQPAIDSNNANTAAINIFINDTAMINNPSTATAAKMKPKVSLLRKITAGPRNILSKFIPNKRSNTSTGPNKPIRIQLHSIDGVFSNLNEKPQVHSDALPNYTDVTGVEVQDPLYGYTVSFCQAGEFYGELVIDGLPAGSWCGFIFTMMMSMAFDFLGFIMTFFLSTSHGTRKGSIVGLSITFIRYGLYILGDSGEEDVGSGSKNGSSNTPEDDEFEYAGYSGLADQWWFGKWVGIALILLSIFIIYHSIKSFKRIRKAIDYARENPEVVNDG